MEVPETSELEDHLDMKDVGQKRYVMNQIFHRVLEDHYEELPEHAERVQGLQKNDGYLYKLSQDFLTSSSTFEKQKKLEKILQHVK
jgi:hypothetical protein